MPVETAVESYYAFRELEGMSDVEAIKATLESFPTIPGAKVCMPSWPVGPPTSSSCSLEAPFRRGRAGTSGSAFASTPNLKCAS